jgi:hypothetical protein
MRFNFYYIMFPICISLTACSTINSTPYKASTSNIISIQKQLPPQGNKKVDVRTFNFASGVDGNITCRLMGPISIAPGKSIPVFIGEALQEELFLAGAYDSTSNIKISGTVEQLSFNSVSPANWIIGLRVFSNKSEGYSVSVNYGFDTSYDAHSACQNVANAFGPAVQELLKKVITNPQFQDLVK